MLNKHTNSSYTISVDVLVNAITGVNLANPSLFQQATEYFKNEPANKLKLSQLEAKIQAAKKILKSESGESARDLKHQLHRLNRKYKVERLSQQAIRIQRLNNAIDVCLNILSLSEGKTFEETQLKSAKFLTTLVLFSPEKGKKQAELHQNLKPAYKAVLSLRLLDKLIVDGVITNTYILKNYDAKSRYEPDATNYECYTQAVILPIMLAAIFQDVGLQHPALAELLDGKEGDKDRYRILNKKEREEVLALTYQFTTDYLKNGLGCQQADAEKDLEIATFEQAELKRLKFQLGLVLEANSTKKGTSEIIRIPQIYSSIIFSTKREYQRSELPSASILLTQMALKKEISSEVSDVFLSIVGQFPLGFGIAYIAQDMNGNELDFYEYAIVTGLNPPMLDQPICRMVTKKMIFYPHGKTSIIKKERNLHFQVARKKLVKMDAKRLTEVMQKLSHNYNAENSKPIIPYYWEPNIYFCVQGNQNLWSTSIKM